LIWSLNAAYSIVKLLIRQSPPVSCYLVPGHLW
jgi:hypothetical protein